MPRLKPTPDDGRTLSYFVDAERHLVCLPYTVENLHLMARRLGISRAWFHRTRGGRHAHYDVPVNMTAHVRESAILLTPRDIVMLCRENTK